MKKRQLLIFMNIRLFYGRKDVGFALGFKKLKIKLSVELSRGFDQETLPEKRFSLQLCFDFGCNAKQIRCSIVSYT